MDFGEALAILKTGGRITRAAWKDHDAFLYLVPGSIFEVNRPPLLGIYPQAHRSTTRLTSTSGQPAGPARRGWPATTHY